MKQWSWPLYTVSSLMQLRFESKQFSMVSLNSQQLVFLSKILGHPFVSTRFVLLETLTATLKGSINKNPTAVLQQ